MLSRNSQECGVSVGGWMLRDATAISADGRTLVGWGWNPAIEQEAWIAVIPEPATLALVALGGLVLLHRRRGASS